MFVVSIGINDIELPWWSDYKQIEAGNRRRGGRHTVVDAEVRRRRRWLTSTAEFGGTSEGDRCVAQAASKGGELEKIPILLWYIVKPGVGCIASNVHETWRGVNCNSKSKWVVAGAIRRGERRKQVKEGDGGAERKRGGTVGGRVMSWEERDDTPKARADRYIVSVVPLCANFFFCGNP